MGNERKDNLDENGGGCGDPYLKICTHLVYISMVKMTYVLLKSIKAKVWQFTSVTTTIHHDWAFISAATLCINEEISGSAQQELV